jgi:hypothetical protein
VLRGSRGESYLLCGVVVGDCYAEKGVASGALIEPYVSIAGRITASQFG